jgi:hypothetical protein
MNRIPMLTLWLAAAALPGLAQAQSVWRCDAGGRVVYQGEPCSGGRAVEAPAPRPAADESEARRIADRQLALAERLGAERRARERQPAALASGILHTRTELSPPKKPRPTAKHPPARDAGVETWRAARPSSR